MFLILGTFFSTFSFVPPAKKAHAAGTTYYVDATGGLDGNDGLSELTAWKTINKVNTSVFNPGDSILFKRGQTWREMLLIPSSGTDGNSITFGAYGTGANPLINGADVITAGSWSQTTTPAPLYSITPNAGWWDHVPRNKRQPITGLTTGASQIQLQFKGSIEAGTINGVGIGVRSGSTINISGAVTRVTFGGNNGVNIGIQEVVTSDVIAFTIVPGTEYIVTYYTTNRSLSVRNVGQGGIWYNNGATDQSQTATVTGYAEIAVYGFVLKLLGDPPAHTYQSALADPTNIGDGMVWEDGARFTQETDILQVDLTAGSFWWDAASDLLYVHASDDSDPGVNGKAYEVSMRTEGVIFAATLGGTGRNYVILEDMDVNHTSGNTNVMGGVVIKGDHNIVRRCNVYQAGRHNIFFYSSTTNSLVEDCNTYEGWDSSQLGAYGNNTNHDNTFRRVTAHNAYQTGNSVLIVSHNVSTGTTPYNLTIEDSEFYNTNVNPSNYLLRRYSDNAQVMAGLVIRRSKFHGSSLNAISLAYTSGAQIYDNVFVGDGWAGNGILLGNSTGSQIYNNTFYSTVAGYIIHLSATSTGTLLKDNIYHGTASYLQVDADSEAGIAADYNDYYGGVASPFSWGGTTYNLADWKTNSLQDAHSLNSDPKFVTPGTDYHLQSTSPAIDAGVDTGITTDYAGKQRYDDPDVPNTGGGAVPYYDIGAYEYVTPPTPVLASTTNPSQTTWYTVNTPEIHITNNTSSTTHYHYLVNQNPTPNIADVAAGTQDSDGVFTVPAGVINTSGVWYIHLIAQNLDNDNSTNYGSYPIWYSMYSYNSSLVDIISVNLEEGQVVHGTYRIEVSASAKKGGINKVEFYIDNILVDTDYDAPYFYDWDTTQYHSPHTVRIVVYDDYGSQSEVSYNVFVMNELPGGTINELPYTGI